MQDDAKLHHPPEWDVHRGSPPLQNRDNAEEGFPYLETENCVFIVLVFGLVIVHSYFTVLSKAALLSCARFTCDIYANFSLIASSRICFQTIQF